MIENANKISHKRLKLKGIKMKSKEKFLMGKLGWSRRKRNFLSFLKFTKKTHHKSFFNHLLHHISEWEIIYRQSVPFLLLLPSFPYAYCIIKYSWVKSQCSIHSIPSLLFIIKRCKNGEEIFLYLTNGILQSFFQRFTLFLPIIRAE